MLSLVSFWLLALLEIGAIPFLPAPFSLVSPVTVWLISRSSQLIDRQVWFLAVLGGLFFDLFSAFPWGTYLLNFLALVGFIVYLVYRYVSHLSLLSQILLLVLGSAFFMSLLGFLRWISSRVADQVRQPISLIEISQVILWSVFLNVSLFLFYRLAKILINYVWRLRNSFSSRRLAA